MRGIEGAVGHAVVADLDWVEVSADGYSTNVPPVRYPMPLVVVAGAGPRDALTDQTFAEDVRTTVSDVVGMVLIINSPSGVVEIAPPADTAKEDARRKRDGRMPLPNLREIASTSVVGGQKVAERMVVVRKAGRGRSISSEAISS